MSWDGHVQLVIADIATGKIRQLTSVAIKDAENQPLRAGEAIFYPDGPVDPKIHRVDWANWRLVDRPIVVDVEENRARRLQTAAGHASVLQGRAFSSSALGSPRTYAGTPEARLKMVEVAFTGGLIFCAESGVGGRHEFHTAAQAQAVLANLAARNDAILLELDRVTAGIVAATTLEQLNLIAEAPTSLKKSP